MRLQVYEVYASHADRKLKTAEHARGQRALCRFEAGNRWEPSERATPRLESWSDVGYGSHWLWRCAVGQGEMAFCGVV